jgi:arylsulfatase A-like enzyme
MNRGQTLPSVCTDVGTQLLIAIFLVMMGCEPASDPSSIGEQTPTPPSETYETPNIILIVIDGLRTDRTGFGGNPRSPTPNLDHFATQSAVFDNSFSQSNESLLSHTSMFTGAYPSEIAWPNYLTFVIPDSTTVLAEAMQAVGYNTAAFIAGGHVKGLFGFQQGFNTFEESRDFGSFYDTVPMAFDWIDSRKSSDGPMFMMLHGYDLHRPYGKRSIFFHPFEERPRTWVDSRITRRSFTERIYKKVFYQNFRHPRTQHGTGERILDPTSYRSMAEWIKNTSDKDRERAIPLSSPDIEEMRKHYDASAFLADTYIGLFLDGLDARGLMKNTVVIITSDHGEGLQEHALSNHRMGLYDTTTKVPMMIGGGAIPEAWRGTHNDTLVAAVDVADTITNIAKTVPIAGSHGRSLWAVLKGEEVAEMEGVYQEGVIGHLSLRTENWRLIFDGLDLTRPELDTELSQLPIDGGRFLLFHTKNDAFEQANLVAHEQPRAEKMRAALVEIRKKLKKGDAKMDPSPEIKKMLQDKGGYF